MSDDITTRLRRDCMSLIADEAADTIDRLRAERDRESETVTSLLRTIGLIRESAGCGGEVMLTDLPAFVAGIRAEAQDAGRWRDDALRLMKERNETLGEIELLRSTVTDCRIEIEKLHKERNEARRSCCEFAAMVDSADTVVMYVDSNRFHEIAMRYMKSRGWDCFKEDSK